MNGAGQLLVDVVQQVHRVSELVAGIAGSSRAQTASIGSIHEAVRLIDEIARNNVSMVAEATAASQALASEAGGLTASVSRFKGKVAVDGLDETALTEFMTKSRWIA